MEKQQEKHQYPNTEKLIEAVMPFIVSNQVSLDFENMPYHHFGIGNEQPNGLYVDVSYSVDGEPGEDGVVWVPIIEIDTYERIPVKLSYAKSPNENEFEIEDPELIDQFIGVWLEKLYEYGYIQKLHAIMKRMGHLDLNSTTSYEETVHFMPEGKEILNCLKKGLPVERQVNYKYPNTEKLIEDLMPFIRSGHDAVTVENMPYFSLYVGNDIYRFLIGNVKHTPHLEYVDKDFDCVVFYPEAIIDLHKREPIKLTGSPAPQLACKGDFSDFEIKESREKDICITDKDFIDQYIGVWREKLHELGYIKKLNLILETIGDRDLSTNDLCQYAVNVMPDINECLSFNKLA